MRSITIFITLLSVVLFSCTPNQNENKTTVATTPQISFKVIDTLAHDTTSFVEGLQYFNNQLYESTGSPEENMESVLGVVKENGKIDRKATLEKKYFGEGITIMNGKIYQLTYRTQVGFVYDLKSFKKIKEFTFSNKEGWGLTNDGKYLIMSDGTHDLTYLDPNSFTVVKTLAIRQNGYGKENINELEYINGYIFANIWQTNEIIKINPSTGEVVAVMDGSSLANYVKSIYPKSMEMNGIAYDSTSKQMFITGKMWPKIFAIQF